MSVIQYNTQYIVLTLLYSIHYTMYSVHHTKYIYNILLLYLYIPIALYTVQCTQVTIQTTSWTIYSEHATNKQSGICCDEMPYYIVMEFMNNGSLLSILQEGPPQSIKVFRILTGISMFFWLTADCHLPFKVLISHILIKMECNFFLFIEIFCCQIKLKKNS